jgi:hypothetical protein
VREFASGEVDVSLAEGLKPDLFVLDLFNASEKRLRSEIKLDSGVVVG